MLQRDVMVVTRQDHCRNLRRLAVTGHGRLCCIFRCIGTRGSAHVQGLRLSFEREAIMRGITRAGVPGPRAKSTRISLLAATLAVPALVVAQSAAVGAVPVVTAARSVLQRPMTATLAARLSKNVDRHVIVILKSQITPAHVGSRAAELRSEVTAAYQAPLLSELREVPRRTSRPTDLSTPSRPRCRPAKQLGSRPTRRWPRSFPT